MKITQLLALLAVGAAGALLVRRYTASTHSSGADLAGNPLSPLTPVVETVLHQHEGEDSPMVHAFEQALEEERRHEEQLAQEVGVRA